MNLNKFLSNHLINDLVKRNVIHSLISKSEKDKEAFLRCLEIDLLEPPDEYILANLDELAQGAEETLREYIYNWKKESFFFPYCEIVKQFYELSDDELAKIANERGYI